jgi:hypothetical protein
VAVPLACFVVLVATMTTMAICGAGYRHHYSKCEQEFFHRHLVIVNLIFLTHQQACGAGQATMLQCSGLLMEGNISSNSRSNTEAAHSNQRMMLGADISSRNVLSIAPVPLLNI